MKRFLQCIAMCLLFADVYGFTSIHSLPMSLKGHPRTVRPSTWLGMSTEGLRGGAGRPAKKSNGVENHTQEAIAFFGSERLPASLIAGACLSVLFVFQLAHGEGMPVGLHKRAYILLLCMAFCNELLAIFTSSLAITRLLQKRHDPMAENAAQMMLREYPLYFMAVRVHFITGLLFFAGGLAIRMYIEYSSGCSRFARAMLFLLGGTCMYMLSLFNGSLIYFKNFGHLWFKYIIQVVKDLTTVRPGPIGIVALGLFFASAFEIGTVCTYFVKHFLKL